MIIYTFTEYTVYSSGWWDLSIMRGAYFGCLNSVYKFINYAKYGYRRVYTARRLTGKKTPMIPIYKNFGLGAFFKKIFNQTSGAVEGGEPLTSGDIVH